MEPLTLESGMRLLQVLRDLKARSHNIRLEWSHTYPANDDPGAVDCPAEDVLIYTKSNGTQWSIVVAFLVFPARTTSGVGGENDVRFEVLGNEVLFELQDGELIHTRRLIFSQS